mmetsp:Transcript_20213/g.43936  ORF Transcript_20213/g.43936 Transcript_20213/m.43936 type:complete len:392 (+) Transcript_20213:77-1252(+)
MGLISNKKMLKLILMPLLPLFATAFLSVSTVSNTAISRQNTHISNGWKSGEDAAPLSSMLHDYLPEPNAGPIAFKCRLTEDQIHTLLSKRLECKSKRQYDDADKILAGLNEGGVFVHDKRREWRADGLNHFGRSSQYVRRGGVYGLSEEDIRDVSQLVEDRSYAKKRKDFHISDELGEKLRRKYQVKVDDKNREWSVVVSNWDEKEGKHGLLIYVPSPLVPPEDPTHTMDDETKGRIAQRLTERVVFRKKKDYKTADTILDELIEQYSVVVDDRAREWKVVLGDIEDDDFAVEAKLSQRSAFVRRGDETTKKDEITTQTAPASNDGDAIQPVEEELELVSDDAVQPIEVEAGVRQMDLESLTVVQLKEQLKLAGLPVSGKKADLILRLNAT